MSNFRAKRKKTETKTREKSFKYWKRGKKTPNIPLKNGKYMLKRKIDSYIQQYYSRASNALFIALRGAIAQNSLAP